MKQTNVTTGVLLILAVLVSISGGAQKSKKDKPTRPAAPAHIWTADWSPDDQLIALGGDDSTLWLYNANNFTLHRSYKAGHMIRCLSWHPNGMELAVAQHDRVQIFNKSTEQFKELPGVKGARTLAWNRSGTLLAVADASGFLSIWNAQGEQLKAIPKEDNNSYFSIDWHPTKEIVATGGDDIRLFDTSGKELVRIQHRKEPTGVLTVRWHPSGSFLASGDYGHDGEGVPTLLQFWNENGTLLQTFRGSKAEYRNIAWSKDGRLLATASDALRIRTADGALVSSAPSREPLWGLDWNSKGTHIVSASFGDGQIRVWTNKAKLVKAIQ